MPVQAYGSAISRHGSTLFRPWFYSVQVRGFTLSRNMVLPSPGPLVSPPHAHGSALFGALGSILPRHMVHLWPGLWFYSVQGHDRYSTLSRHMVLPVQALGSTLSRPTVLPLPVGPWFYLCPGHDSTLSRPMVLLCLVPPPEKACPPCLFPSPGMLDQRTIATIRYLHRSASLFHHHDGKTSTSCLYNVFFTHNLVILNLILVTSIFYSNRQFPF